MCGKVGGIILVRLVGSLFLIFTLFSCIEKKEVLDAGISIETSGVTDPVTFEVVGGNDRGEQLLGGEDDIVLIRIKNNSKYNIKDILIMLDEQSNARMKWTTKIGETFGTFPGGKGTCKDILAPSQECFLEISFRPMTEGEKIQDITFSYRNLVERVKEYKKINYFVGSLANLAFVSENGQTSFSWGIHERTNRTNFSKTLILKNTGGLSAKSLDIKISNSTSANTHKIERNTCPEILYMGEECEIDITYSPANYGLGAPDGNDDIQYTSEISFSYVAGPSDSIPKRLIGYFDSLATTIEAKMRNVGLATISFKEQVVGNIETIPVKFRNNGYKEGIVHKVNVFDENSAHIASCIKGNGDALLSCRDPEDNSKILKLSEIPFQIYDKSECITNYESLDYSRSQEGLIINGSQGSPKIIPGKANNRSGGECDFDVKFHSSVEHKESGNFNNYKLVMEYDSTWKDKITKRGERYELFDVLITEAKYVKAAILSSTNINLDQVNVSKVEVSGSRPYLRYDLGRIALVSDASIVNKVSVGIKNTGGIEAEILNIKDGSGNIISSSASNLSNTYYHNAYHEGCDNVTKISGTCSVKFDIVPIASSLVGASSQNNEENSKMFDNLVLSPMEKILLISYKDGSLLNDDGTPLVNRELKISMTATLVRKGVLVFSDPIDQGTLLRMVAGNVYEKSIKLTNKGTGAITHIAAVQDKKLKFRETKTGTYPYSIIQNTCDGVVDKIDFEGNQNLSNSSNITSVLNPGLSCEIKVQYKLNSNDVYKGNNYNNSGRREFDRAFRLSDQGNIEQWEPIAITGTKEVLSFTYYDGDGISGNDYTPEIEGYGNKHTISGGNNGEYPIQVSFVKQGTLIPSSITPESVGISIRHGKNLPAIQISNDEWGNNVPAELGSIVATATGNEIPQYPGSLALQSQSSFIQKTNGVQENSLDTYEYIVFLGHYTEKENVIAKAKFDIKNVGMVDSTDINILKGSDNGINLDYVIPNSRSLSSNQRIVINTDINLSGHNIIQGTSKDVFNTLTLSYKNGRISASGGSENFLIKIHVFATLHASSFNNVQVGFQDYAVESDGLSIREELAKGANEQIVPEQKLNTILYNSKIFPSEMISEVEFRGVRGSEVYDKKRIIFTNNTSSPISNIVFFLKDKEEYTKAIYSNGIVGYHPEVNPTCTSEITLNNGDSCYVEYIYKAPKESESEKNTYGIFSYNIGEDQYQEQVFKVKFSPVSPATLELYKQSVKLVGESILDESNNVIQNSYPIDLGAYILNGSGHVLLGGGNNEISYDNFTNPIEILNTSEEKGSFLAAYQELNGINSTPESHFDGTGYVEIFKRDSYPKINVFMNKSCFYGDDQNNSNIPEDEKGFDINSIGKCLLKYKVTFDRNKYLGVSIPSAENHFSLKYYNSRRASKENIKFHLVGFVEPNRMSMAGGSLNDIYNVEASGNGRLVFDFDPFIERDRNWGVLQKYRVYYTTDKSQLQKIFENKDSINFIEVPSDRRSVEINNLRENYYYYLMIVGLRSTDSNIDFISVNPDFSIKEIVMPNSSMIYSYKEKVLIDETFYQDEKVMSRRGAIDYCSSEFESLKKNGVNTQVFKKLITNDIFNYLDENGNFNEYNLGAIPHWTSDGAIDIRDLGIFDINSGDTSGETPDRLTTFRCKDLCYDLYLIRGGYGLFVAEGGSYYTEEDMGQGYPRCYIEQ